MFGNRMNYTQSPGGIRRGLIYQSSDGSIGPKIFKHSFLAYGLDRYNYRVYNKKLIRALEKPTAGSYEFAPLDGMTLSTHWYPIAIFKPAKITLNNKTVDETIDIDGYTSADGKIKIKYENVTLKKHGSQQGAVYTRVERLIVVYYDISNVPTYQGSGQVSQYSFYDIQGQFTGDYIPLYMKNGFKAIIGNNSLSLEGKSIYCKYAINSSPYGGDDINNFVDMSYKIDCTFDLSDWGTRINNVHGTARLWSQNGTTDIGSGLIKMMYYPLDPFYLSMAYNDSSYKITTQVHPYNRDIIHSDPQNFYFFYVGNSIGPIGANNKIQEISASEFSFVENNFDLADGCGYGLRLLYMSPSNNLSQPINSFDFTSEFSDI